MKLIYDEPGQPPVYLVTDEEAEYNATQLNAALPNAAPGTIITNAGMSAMKQKDEEGSWAPIELGGGGGSSTVYLTTSTETNLSGLISGDGSNLGVTSVDASPTDSSTNPVQSGGVYTALGGKAPTDHAASASTYGLGDSTNYGHVQLSDAIDSTSDTTDGVAATPAAVKTAYDLANGKQDPITVDATPTDGSTNPVQSDGVYDALALKAPLASPTLTGTPAAPTAAAGTSTTQIATTAFVQGELAKEIIKVTISGITGTGAVTGGATFSPLSGPNVTADHVVLSCVWSNPAVVLGDWTFTTSSGSISYSGIINGTSDVTLLLGLVGQTL